jgi:hypothetical protein
MQILHVHKGAQSWETFKEQRRSLRAFVPSLKTGMHGAISRVGEVEHVER